MRTLVWLLLVVHCRAQGVLIDRIAVVVEESIIKDSDIDRDIRVTQFLNDQPLRINPADRKKAAGKLIDQVLLRDEIKTGGYPRATQQQADRQLQALVNERFHTQEAFRAALEQYGLDTDTLCDQFRWQLTVLGFIETRFRPAVVLSDDAVNKYYREHLSGLHKDNPKGSTEDLRSKARDTLTEEEVNRLFFAWLDERRKGAKISFHEDGLA
jgi:hypothetical protein